MGIFGRTYLAPIYMSIFTLRVYVFTFCTYDKVIIRLEITHIDECITHMKFNKLKTTEKNRSSNIVMIMCISILLINNYLRN